MSQPLYRDAFETPQSVAYFDPDGLHKQTGRPISDFPAVVVKELVDNALDACESSAAGVAPEVVIHADRQVHDLVLAVGDNGNGIPSDVVERTLNYNTFTSDKALYRTPTRGQQGNALKTIISMPFALGSQHPLVIVQARGIEHRISAGLSAADHPDIRYHVMPCEREVGTAVYVGLPLRAFYASWAEHRSRLRGLARSYHLFNPHAKVIFRASESAVNHGESDEPAEREIQETHLPTDTNYQKFMPTAPLVVHWFKPADFARLLSNYILLGKDMPIGEFTKRFRGFSSRAKASAVRSALPSGAGVRVLSDLTKDDIETLYFAMRREAKEPSHKVLGAPIGEGHLVGALREFYGYGDGLRSWYAIAKTSLNGAPAVVEVAVVETPEKGGLHIGLNHSPTYTDPLSENYLIHYAGQNEISGRGIAGFLRDARSYSDDYSAANTAVAVHITAAAPTTLDRGKTRLSVSGRTFEHDLEKTLWAVSKVLHKEAKKRERDAAAAARAAEQREKARSRAYKRIPKVDACFEVMEDAYAYATGNESLPTTARDLYYAVRNRIERFGYDADELSDNYFSAKVLPRYQREVRLLPLVHYEPRGILYEPHGGEEVPLGTRSVAEYSFPDYVYNKILYIEKRGRVGILQAAEVDKRHDMALIGGQGYATEAVRTLFQNAEKGEYQLFVLHDADRDGYGIARTLREETERMPGYKVDVIDIGLKLADALAMGKRPESQTVESRLDVKVEATLTDVEREHFVGEERRVLKNGKRKTQWLVKRVELNDLSSPQLVEYVERKLRASGVRGKVIPPGDALGSRVERMYREEMRVWVERAIDDVLNTGELKDKMVKDFQERFKLEWAERWVKTGFKRDDTQSWRDAVKNTLKSAHRRKHEDALRDAVREYIVETVAAEEPKEGRTKDYGPLENRDG